MRRTAWVTLLTFLGIMMGGMALPTDSSAILQVSIDGVVCADNAGCDTNPLANQITFVQTSAGFVTTTNTSFTNAPGTAAGGLLDLNYAVNCLSNPACTGGTITLLATATDFNQPTTATALLTSTIGGTLSGTGSVTAQQWLVDANTAFATSGCTPGAQGPFTSLTYSSTATANCAFSVPYSLTDRVIVTVAAGGSATGDLLSTASAVPEPSTLLLFGVGLVGLGVWARKRVGK